MIHYKFSVSNPASHYIDVSVTIQSISTNQLELQLPSWRPGRYELGNFSKNIKSFEAIGIKGEILNFSKKTKDLWVVDVNGNKFVTIKYSYFTHEINAGNCYTDCTQLYINPVHLCVYVPEKMNEQHVVELDMPSNYSIATSLKQNQKTLIAESFDELADSPIIASSNLQSDFFILQGIKFWLHFNGECKPDFNKIKSDFIKFTTSQLNFWGDFPVSEYHYLFQILPFKFYHGVEHQKSTVIALGQGYNINQGSIYESLLGVSSHELFHTWNIKYIRPIEMLPYDFTKENYAKTGYIYEGFTTYYGDVMLLTSGVFNLEQYFETLEERLLKHFHNYGRFNLSVIDSSFDTWLDGYTPGAPYRKTSIYDEGNLIALMLDVLILKQTKNTKGLKHVCQKLYNDFGKKNIGYCEEDIITICEEVSGISLSSFFENFVYGKSDYEPQLNECFHYLGIEMNFKASPNISEHLFGFKTIDFMHNKKVSLIAPNSPSWNTGLSIGDEIIAVNGYSLKNDFNEWMSYFKEDAILLTISSNQQIKNIKLTPSAETFFAIPTLKKNIQNSENFEYWKKHNGMDL